VKTFIHVTLLRSPIPSDSENEEISIRREVTKRFNLAKKI
jgi:hypothetical protein